jgi:hypothetical protein
LGFFFNMSMMIARSMGCFCSSMAAMICHRYIWYSSLVKEMEHTYLSDWLACHWQCWRGYWIVSRRGDVLSKDKSRKWDLRKKRHF